MNTHYTYLILDVASVLFPFILSFDKKVAFYKTWKFLFPSLLISALFFIVWDELFTQQGVWNFNPDYITGIRIGHLPIEEILFFVCVPYSCIFIYEVCKAYIPKAILVNASSIITWGFIALCLLLCLLFYNKTYTIVNAGICLGLLLITNYFLPKKELGKFYLAYFISLIPFLICNGLLTSLPVVVYNNEENMQLRIFTIPAEDTIYCLSLILSPTLLMEFFKSRRKLL